MELHILSPSTLHDLDTLIKEHLCNSGDLIADLRRFSPSVHMAMPNGGCRDVTQQFELPPDPMSMARQWLIDFTRQTGLQDMLAVKGISFWWTLNSLRFAPGWSDHANCLTWISTLRSISDRTKFGSVTIHGYSKDLFHCTKEIFAQGTLQMERERQSKRAPSTPRRNPLLLLARLILGALYLPVAMLIRPQICFLGDTSLLRTARSGTSRAVQDVYLGPAEKALRRLGWRIAVIERHGWNATWRGLLIRGFFFPNDMVFLMAAPQLLQSGLWRKTTARWRDLWEISQAKIRGQLSYQGVDLAPLFLPIIRDQFLSNGPSLEIMARFWQWAFRRWSARLLFVNNSYGRSAVSAVTAAKVLGIPTVEQQHGVIGNNHSAYLIPPGIGTKSTAPQCDRILVWGEKTKRILVESGAYKPNQVRVCGFPRMDSLLGDLPSRTVTLDRLGISTDKTVVLYTSNLVAHGFLTDILDGIASTESSDRVHWLIKLHPRENTRSEWEAEIKRRDLSSVQVTEGELDFHSLLAACDIHVSYVSTTLIEAAVLGKLNLGLDVPGIVDPVGYRADGGYLPVHPRRLGNAVTEILADTHSQLELGSAQARFANDWCLTDGRALERIIHEVEDMIGTPKGRSKPHG